MHAAVPPRKSITTSVVLPTATDTQLEASRSSLFDGSVLASVGGVKYSPAEVAGLFVRSSKAKYADRGEDTANVAASGQQGATGAAGTVLLGDGAGASGAGDVGGGVACAAGAPKVGAVVMA